MNKDAIKEFTKESECLFRDISLYNEFMRTKEYRDMSDKAKHLIRLGLFAVRDRVLDVNRDIEFLQSL